MDLKSRVVGLVLALYYIVAPSVSAVMYLYYSSPGDSLGHYSGVWGGPIDVSKRGKADNLRQSGFHCAYMYDGGFYTGFIVKGMFLDPISKRVIVHLAESFESRVSLIEGPICTEEPECPSEFSGRVHVYMAHGENEDLIAANPGPFAMWNSSVYMIVERWSQGAGMPYGHRLELRLITGCKDQYPFTIHRRFDIDECSRLLATLRQEQTLEQEATTFHAAFHLHILQVGAGEEGSSAETGARAAPAGKGASSSEKGREQLVFITQVYNWTIDDKGDKNQFGITLMYATPAGAVHDLFYTPLPQSYAGQRLRLMETGGISWRQGTLCWSAVETIRCATWWGSGQLKDVKVVLKAGQASAVCHDTDLYLSKANFTTGVAIADTADGISLYFGCRGESPMAGGAGYLHYQDTPGSSSQIEALSDKADVIYGGSMFLTDLCDIRPISIDDRDRYDSDSKSNHTKVKDPFINVGAAVRWQWNIFLITVLLTGQLLTRGCRL